MKKVTLLLLMVSVLAGGLYSLAARDICAEICAGAETPAEYSACYYGCDVMRRMRID